MSSEIPKVLVLGPITPSSDSAREQRLEYPQLESATKKHTPYEYPRIEKFLDTAPESLEEHAEAQQLAMYYLLMSSLALSRTVDPELWSQRYTEAASEIYGQPDPEIAQKLWLEQQNGFKGDTEKPFSEASEIMRDFINEKYAPVFEILMPEDENVTLNAEQIATRFEAALQALATEYDDDWSNWSVVRNPDKDSLSVMAGSKKIIIGMKRASVTPQQLKALFGHEVLIHGLRGVNGQKISKEFGTGLPGYLDAEEGLGVFTEYAITGEVSDKIIDRYIDIAYALGQVDGHLHTREELLECAMQRALERNERAEAKKSLDDIEKEVYAHINRIYRGSLGNEHVGIFPKDISYYKGFIDMGRYITEQLETGMSIEDIFDFLTSGKFDPTNERHIEYRARHVATN